MKKTLFVALLVVTGGLAWAGLPELYFVYGFRAALAQRDPAHPKDFDAAIRHLKSVRSGSLVHEIAPAYVLALEGQRDLPVDFERFTPEQHYFAAVYPCRHDPENPGPIYTDCLLDSPQDIARALRHLAAISPSSPLYDDAGRASGLLKIQRDKPEDFEAARLADYQQCKKPHGRRR